MPRSPTPRQIAVVLADGHAVLRRALCALLQAEKDMCVVGQAGDGREAIQLTKQLKPDVVLMDVAMPLLDGVEATRQINALQLKSKVLILSQHSDDDHVRRALAAGAIGYLVKQLAAPDVVRAIREVKKGNAYFSPSISKRLIEFARQASGAYKSLSPRESEVLRLVAEGYTNKQVAAALSISVKMVEKFRSQLKRKLHINTVAGLIHYALAAGMIEKPKEGVKTHLPGQRN